MYVQLHIQYPVLGANRQGYEKDVSFTSKKWARKRVESEPIFLNVYGAQESIPRNELRQPIYVAWRAGTINPIPYQFLAPIDCLKIQALTKGKKPYTPSLLKRRYSSLNKLYRYFQKSLFFKEQ